MLWLSLVINKFINGGRTWQLRAGACTMWKWLRCGWGSPCSRRSMSRWWELRGGRARREAWLPPTASTSAFKPSTPWDPRPMAQEAERGRSAPPVRQALVAGSRKQDACVKKLLSTAGRCWRTRGLSSLPACCPWRSGYECLGLCNLTRPSSIGIHVYNANVKASWVMVSLDRTAHKPPVSDCR